MSSGRSAQSEGKGKEAPSVTVKELSTRLGMTPRALRGWLRAEGRGLGARGKRYEFIPSEAEEVAQRVRAAEVTGDAG